MIYPFYFYYPRFDNIGYAKHTVNAKDELTCHCFVPPKTNKALKNEETLM